MSSLTSRGYDAWRFFDGENMYKEPGCFTNSPNKNIVSKLTGEQFCVPQRLATVSDPSINDNNHPFKLGPLTMAHNGQLYSSEPYSKPPNNETDNHSILY